VLNCAIGGTSPGTGYGQLHVAGTTAPNGALSVGFANGFSPALGDSFTVLTAGAINGAFSNFLYPSNNVAMQLSNAPNAVIVRVTDIIAPPPPLLSAQVLGTNLNLTWNAASNFTYRVEFKPGLAFSNWSALPGDVTSTGRTAAKLDPLTPSNRFYRVRLLP
jgi:hypothetical protein